MGNLCNTKKKLKKEIFKKDKLNNKKKLDMSSDEEENSEKVKLLNKDETNGDFIFSKSKVNNQKNIFYYFIDPLKYRLFKQSNDILEEFSTKKDWDLINKSLKENDNLIERVINLKERKWYEELFQIINEREKKNINRETGENEFEILKSFKEIINLHNDFKLFSMSVYNKIFSCSDNLLYHYENTTVLNNVSNDYLNNIIDLYIVNLEDKNTVNSTLSNFIDKRSNEYSIKFNLKFNYNNSSKNIKSKISTNKNNFKKDLPRISSEDWVNGFIYKGVYFKLVLNNNNNIYKKIFKKIFNYKDNYLDFDNIINKNKEKIFLLNFSFPLIFGIDNGIFTLYSFPILSKNNKENKKFIKNNIFMNNNENIVKKNNLKKNFNLLLYNIKENYLYKGTIKYNTYIGNLIWMPNISDNKFFATNFTIFKGQTISVFYNFIDVNYIDFFNDDFIYNNIIQYKNDDKTINFNKLNENKIFLSNDFEENYKMINYLVVSRNLKINNYNKLSILVKNKQINKDNNNNKEVENINKFLLYINNNEEIFNIYKLKYYIKKFKIKWNYLILIKKEITNKITKNLIGIYYIFKLLKRYLIFNLCNKLILNEKNFFNSKIFLNELINFINSFYYYMSFKNKNFINSIQIIKNELFIVSLQNFYILLTLEKEIDYKKELFELIDELISNPNILMNIIENQLNVKIKKKILKSIFSHKYNYIFKYYNFKLNQTFISRWKLKILELFNIKDFTYSLFNRIIKKNKKSSELKIIMPYRIYLNLNDKFYLLNTNKLKYIEEWIIQFFISHKNLTNNYNDNIVEIKILKIIHILYKNKNINKNLSECLNDLKLLFKDIKILNYETIISLIIVLGYIFEYSSLDLSLYYYKHALIIYNFYFGDVSSTGSILNELSFFITFKILFLTKITNNKKDLTYYQQLFNNHLRILNKNKYNFYYLNENLLETKNKNFKFNILDFKNLKNLDFNLDEEIIKIKKIEELSENIPIFHYTSFLNFENLNNNINYNTLQSMKNSTSYDEDSKKFSKILESSKEKIHINKKYILSKEYKIKQLKFFLKNLPIFFNKLNNKLCKINFEIFEKNNEFNSNPIYFDTNLVGDINNELKKPKITKYKYFNYDGIPYLFGSNNKDQLGFITSKNERKIIKRECINIPLLLYSLSNNIIIDIYCKNDFVFLRNINNHIFSLGSNNYGKLAIGKNSSELNSSIIPIPVNFDTIIKKISLGNEFGLALDENGNVYSWGLSEQNLCGIENENKDENFFSLPKKIDQIPKITKIFAGFFHSFLLDINNKIWSFGKNEFGQLGLEDINYKKNEDNSINTIKPSKINLEIYKDILIKDVSLAETHSLILLENGLVLGCGYTGFGQLGINIKNTKFWLPVILENINNINEDQFFENSDTNIIFNKIKKIFTGPMISVFVNNLNEIFVTGNNKWNQININNNLNNESKNIFIPQKIVGIEGMKIYSFKSGISHSFLYGFNKNEYKFYSWGNNKNCQLGNGENTNNIDFKEHFFFDKKKIESISVGNNFSSLIIGDINQEIILKNLNVIENYLNNK